MKTYSQEELRLEAQLVVGENIDVDEPGYIDPELALWRFDKNFNVQRLLPLMDTVDEFQSWWNDEVEILGDVKGECYFNDLLSNEIREPIIISIIDSRIFVWDGWHRIAASVITGKTTIPVIFGVPITKNALHIG